MNNKKSKSKIIVDPRGQWAHPGKATRIPGNDITMDDVPYPVMAYPNFGSPVMMQPEKEYDFPGAKYVDEYPVLKKGGSKVNNHLKVKQSKIAGADKGLFANANFKKNQLIGLAHRDGQPVGDIGKMHNHSDKPNMHSVKVGNERFVYAKRNIKPGEELTTDYRLQPELEQPEDFKKGGETPKVRIPTGGKGIKSKAYSRSLEATNRLFALNPLFDKPKSRKRKIFDPNASFYDEGGQASSDDYVDMDLSPEEIEAYRAEGYVVEELDGYKEGGTLLTKKVTCKKCGWTWNAADGGDDMTTCHKCGGKGLVHAQKGGEGIPSIPLKEGRATYKRLAYGVNDKMAMAKDGGYVELDLTAEEIKAYKDGGYVVEEVGNYQDGGATVPTQAELQSITPTVIPEMIPTGDIVAPPVVEQPVQQEVQQQIPVVSTPAPVQTIPTKKEVEKVAMPKIEASGDTIAIQKKLVAAGYNIGSSGPSKNGVDGIMGNRTKMALDAFNAGIPPSKIKTPVSNTTPKKNQVVNKNLGTGYLPYLDKGEEVCVKGKGCSSNVSIKMGNLLGGIAEGDIWANDAWFNKSDVLNKGGDLIYETSERDVSKMPKVPKDVYSKLQVGDYVQLNRPNTKTSNEFAAQKKAGLENENLEHLGFVVGKDKDGTPLIWHGSETGKAFIQRIDAPITLNDHDKSVFTYQIASIVRSPSLKNADMSGLQNTAYYSTIDPKQKLVPGKTATERQRQAAHVINSSVKNIKNLGYSQEDANFVGQILVGGIMQQETSGGESLKRVPKQAAAYLIKDVLEIPAFDIPLVGRFPGKEFEKDEASTGYYQMKSKLNFTNDDGTLNALGKKLEKLGVDPKNIGTFDIGAQTKAGTIILLENYEKLKKDPDFNVKTNMYKGKIPASYILAKSWQAGADWQNRDKYKKFLNTLDITYSDKALMNAVNTMSIAGSKKTVNSEYAKVKAYQDQINAKKIAAQKKINEEKLRKQRIQQSSIDKGKQESRKIGYAESTAIRNLPYNKAIPDLRKIDLTKKSAVKKPATKTFWDQTMDQLNAYSKAQAKKPVAKKPAAKKPVAKKPVAKKPAPKPLTFANTLKNLNNPFYNKTSLFSKGGIVTELSPKEIEEYKKAGYIVEEVD